MGAHLPKDSTSKNQMKRETAQNVRAQKTLVHKIS